MQIHIRFAGEMARHAGEGRRTIDIHNPATVADAVQALASDGAVAGELSRCAYSVGGVAVGASYQLFEGMELVLEL